MAESVICYPSLFLERPQDRVFLEKLRRAGVGDDTSKLMLYRIWADFATGQSDRRGLAKGGSHLAADPYALSIESFCEWRGEAGLLVSFAVESGFLRLEGGGDERVLVCDGFFPINSGWSKSGNSMQKKGAFTRILRRQEREAKAEVDEREELWSRTNAVPELGENQRRAAVLFIARVCRALQFPPPTDAELNTGMLRRAHEIVTSTDEVSLEQTLLWLLSMRGDQLIPVRADLALKMWPDLMRSAKAQIR